MKSKIDPKNQITVLSDKLRDFQNAYYRTGRPEVSDLEYDRLFDELLRLEGENPELRLPDSPTYRVGSDLSSDLPEVTHSIPVLSLDKAYTLEAIMEWMQKTAVKGGRDLSFTVEEKIDGVSIVLYYEQGVLKKAVTRGNGYVGNDVTANIKTIHSVPLRLKEPVSLAVRGEVYLPVESFIRLNKTMDVPYANPRNLTAGTIRRIKSRETAEIPLEIFVYEGFFEDSDQPETHAELTLRLNDLGFRINPRFGIFTREGELNQSFFPGWSVGTISQLGAFIEAAAASRKNLDHEIDGLVVKVNELDVREELGFTGHHPRWAVAYKFESPEGETVVEGIDVQVGRTGRITPVARVKPVRIGGSVVSNVTLHNQDYIDILELSLGDAVAVSKRGDVIPAVERVLEKNELGNGIWKNPAVCPSCETALQKIGAHTFCMNSECPDQVFGRVQFFTAKAQMDIENLGPETIQFLMSEKLLKDVPDIYQIDFRKLVGKPGFGEKKCESLLKGVEDSKNKPYSSVLASLGIPDLGKKAVELLLDDGILDIDSLFKIVDEADADRLIGIKGFGEKTVASIISELSKPAVRDRIRQLREAGLQFKQEKAANGDLPDQVFAGQVWCVTGSFINFTPRGKAMEAVKLRGGRIVTAVTGSTTHLLAGTGAGSKLKKAISLGVVIVTEDEFIEILNSGAID
ncbi:MAG: NAD-dependent DNA ligase LigA [Bacteroidetes bacterium]|nr:NAD-dependent DNA ligase LigA [Bacteroidota bacterium]